MCELCGNGLNLDLPAVISIMRTVRRETHLLRSTAQFLTILPFRTVYWMDSI